MRQRIVRSETTKDLAGALPLALLAKRPAVCNDQANTALPVFSETKYFEQEPIQRRFDFSGVLRLAKPAFFRHNESLHWIASIKIYIVNGR